MSGCQRTGDGLSSGRVPWDGDDRGAEKTRIFRYVRNHRDGVPLSKVVRDVFDDDAVASAGADYQLARRFVDDCEHIETAVRGGLTWAMPAVSAFGRLNLSPQYASRKTAGGRGGGVSSDASSRSTGDGAVPADCRAGDDGRDPAYPKGRAQSVLGKQLVLDDSDGGHDYRGELLRELGTEREVQQDKFKILQRIRGSGPEHLLIPYATRFNSTERAADIRDGFRSALSTAADRHDDAVMLTLTTDPARFDSHAEAMDGLTDAKSRFMAWLATDYQLGYRPENLTVLEFTESGVPHLHVVFFGRRWLMPQPRLAEKWSDVGQGRVVDIRSATTRSSSDVWRLHDDGTTVALRDYLGKAIDGLRDLAGMDEGRLREAVEAGDIGLWRQALYWATERQYYSCSPSLKADSDGGDGLPFVRRYEFVGVAQYRDIPAHVRESAVRYRRGRPPPDSTQQVSR